MECELAIILPTYSRPNRLKWIENNIREHTPNIYNLYFIVDSVDTDSIEACKELSNLPNVYYLISEGRGSNTALNLGVKSTAEPYIYTAFDDQEFTVQWYEKAKNEFIANPHAMVVGTWDYFTRQGNSGFLIKREYLEQAVIGEPGKLFHEGYKHLYSDEEFVKTAQSKNMFVHSEASVVMHHHYTMSQKYSSDATYREGEDQSLSDSHLWAERKQRFCL